MITEWLAEVIAQRIRLERRCINTLQMYGTDDPNTEFLACYGANCLEAQCPACEGHTYLGTNPLDYCPICKGFGIVLESLAADVRDLILLHRAGNLSPERKPYKGAKAHRYDYDSVETWEKQGGRLSQRARRPASACVNGEQGDDLHWLVEGDRRELVERPA